MKWAIFEGYDGASTHLPRVNLFQEDTSSQSQSQLICTVPIWGEMFMCKNHI